jgi:stage II sporulation protein AB (anti-sigma F factor)
MISIEELKVDNKMEVSFYSISENERLARVIAATFATRLDPTIEEINDIKTAVSEAVTNAIVHGYEHNKGNVVMKLAALNRQLYIEVLDKGCGIENVNEARKPLFTTKPDEERSGMGFVFMEVFMDEIEVISKVNDGTIVKMMKTIGKQEI